MKLRVLVIITVLAVFTQGCMRTAEDYNNLGLQYYNQGNYAKAIKYFLKAKAINEKTIGKEHPDYAASLTNLGLVSFQMGDYEKAESYYLEALTIYEKVLGDDNPDYALALNNTGLMYFQIGDYEKAENCYLNALAAYEKAVGKEDSDYALPLINLGWLYCSMGYYEEAENCYIEALDIQEKTLGKESSEYATTLNNMGWLYQTIGYYEKAEHYYMEALDIREKVLGKEHPVYAETLNNMGWMYYNMGDYAKAKSCYLETIAIFKKTLNVNHTSYASTLNNLGVLYSDMGDYEKAENCYLESLAIREKVLGKEHPDYAASLLALGWLYYNMGDYEKAESYYLNALAVFEKVYGKEHSTYAATLNNMGILYYSMGDFERAESCYLESGAIRERVLGEEHPDYAQSLNNLGLLYYQMGFYEEAENYYQMDRAITEKVFGKEHPDYAKSLLNLGLLNCYMENYAEAERCYLGARAIQEKALGKEHPDYVITLDYLYMMYLEKKEYAQALTNKQEQIKINTDLINKNFSFQTEQQRDAYWNDKSYSFNLSYSLSFYYPVPASNILNYNNALFSKGLLLRTTNDVRDSIYASGNQSLIGQFNELGSIRQKISVLRQNGGDESEIKSLEEKAESLDKSLTKTSSAFKEFQADLAVNWQSIQKSLKQKEAAIEFVSFKPYDKDWTDKILYAALVVKTGINAPIWVPLCEEDTLAELFAKLEGKRSQEQARILYDEYGEALYNTVWRPLEKTLEDVNVVFYSPSGLLHKVAFSAIPANEKTRLSDKYNLNMVSSTREVVYIRSKTPGKPGSAAIYGGLNYTVDADTMKKEALAYNVPGTRSGAQRDLTFVDDSVDTSEYQKKTGSVTWSYLQFTDTESKGIYQLLTANRIPAVLYNGVKGNKESFKSLNGKKTVVIHLATHGFFNQDIKKNYEEQERLQQSGGGQKVFENPLHRSGLILAGANTWAKNPVEGTENGILLADEVAGMNLLGANLIVLSACETALGDVNNSEGVFGLQRAFKLAGAQTLIMSLWKVDDEATSILISEFYKNWLSGKSKQDAFKEAQRKVRADSRYAPPFYWAAFVMMD